jgi:hypothetical protein
MNTRSESLTRQSPSGKLVGCVAQDEATHFVSGSRILNFRLREPVEIDELNYLLSIRLKDINLSGPVSFDHVNRSPRMRVMDSE